MWLRRLPLEWVSAHDGGVEAPTASNWAFLPPWKNTYNSRKVQVDGLFGEWVPLDSGERPGTRKGKVFLPSFFMMQLICLQTLSVLLLAHATVALRLSGSLFPFQSLSGWYVFRRRMHGLRHPNWKHGHIPHHEVPLAYQLWACSRLVCQLCPHNWLVPLVLRQGPSKPEVKWTWEKRKGVSLGEVSVCDDIFCTGTQQAVQKRQRPSSTSFGVLDNSRIHSCLAIIWVFRHEV